MKLKIFTDGGARGNPGSAAVGVVIKNEQDQIIDKFGKTIGISTNNVAEYTGVIEALKFLLITNNKKLITNTEGIEFFLDSELVVSQLNGIFKVKNSNLKQLLIKVRELEGEIGGNVSYSSIPREKNRLADSLVNQALDNDRI